MAKAKKLPSGAWRCLVYDYTDDANKRHYESFTAASRKEAEYLAAEFTLNKKNRKRDTEQLTVKTAAEKYISVKSGVLSPSTVREYERMINSYLPYLHDI